MPNRSRTTPNAPPSFPPLPPWARVEAGDKNAGDASFLAGAALAAMHPIARDTHAIGSLWRQRLALTCAAALARDNGRTEDENTLRDHFYLRRDGDDPGPAGFLLLAWRFLGTPAAAGSKAWPSKLADMLGLRMDDALQDVFAHASDQLRGEGSAVRAAAAVATKSLRLRPGSRPLALWLADAVLAQRLKWPAPVPMLAAHIKRGDLRRVSDHVDGEAAWLNATNLAYARGAANAADLYADLGRRAERLIAAAPKLRSKGADVMIATLLSEDAQAAGRGQMSDRSGRRLFERLVALGAVRELTGRPTFRLYGL